MEKTIIEITKLTASEGMVLTNGTIYGTQIFLAEGENLANYREITKEEYEELTKTEGVDE